MLSAVLVLCVLGVACGLLLGFADARFSGGSVGLVIGHVGPEAALGGPIAFIEDGDEIVVDLNTNELNCPAIADPATLAARKAAWSSACTPSVHYLRVCG